MREVFGFLLIMLCAALLMLLGEWLHRIFRAAKLPPRPTSQALCEEAAPNGEQRYSVRHLERFFLAAFVWFLSFVLFLMRESNAELESFLSPNSVSFLITIVICVGVWWAFRRGTLR